MPVLYAFRIPKRELKVDKSQLRDFRIHQNPEKGVESEAVEVLSYPRPLLNPEKGVESGRDGPGELELDDQNPEKGVESILGTQFIYHLDLRIPKRELKEFSTRLIIHHHRANPEKGVESIPRP